MVANLKFLRNQARISQQQLANAVGVSQQSINKYENHAVEPDIKTLIALADYLNVTIDCLVGRIGPDEAESTCSEAYCFAKAYKRLGTEEQQCIKMILNAFDQSK